MRSKCDALCWRFEWPPFKSWFVGRACENVIVRSCNQLIFDYPRISLYNTMVGVMSETGVASVLQGKTTDFTAKYSKYGKKDLI